MGGVQLRRRLLARGNFRLLLAGDGLLLPGDYSIRMQRLTAALPYENPCENYFISFQTWFYAEIKLF